MKAKILISILSLSVGNFAQARMLLLGTVNAPRDCKIAAAEQGF